MQRSESFSLPETRIHLPDGPRLQTFAAEPALWSRMKGDARLRTGRMMGVHAVRCDEDVHASQWERHPNGDELLCLISGRVDVVLKQGADAEQLIALQPLTGVIVPQGVWHRLHVRQPAVLVALAAHEATELRASDAIVQAEAWSKQVYPHSRLQALADDLWVVRGQHPSASLPRNMIVYRYDSDALLLHSVVALEEHAMRELEALGRPAIMMIPSWDHHAHIVAFKQRYPALTVVCPAASRTRVERRLAVDASCEEYFPRHGMSFHVPPGMDPVEGVLECRLRHGRVAIIMNDLITNVPDQPGFHGLLLRLTASSGRPRVIPLVRRRLNIERPVLRGYLEQLAKREDIAVLTTSHGECIRSDVASVLARVARDLG